jgi:hypothetical protein
MDAIESRDAGNSMEGGQQQQRQWEHQSINSRRETQNNKDARNSRDLPTTVLASAGTPTTQYGRQKLMSFCGNSP